MYFGNLKEKKKIIFSDVMILDEKEQESNFSSHLAARRMLRKGELEDVLLKEKVFWRQKSRVKWIKKGIVIQNFFIGWPMVGGTGNTLDLL